MKRKHYARGAVSAAALGVAAGAGLWRRRHSHEDRWAGEDFTLIEMDRPRLVNTLDGVTLGVRECGPAEAPLTAVFVHGFSNRMTSFHMQRRELAQRWGPNVRMVFFDMRGHGLSSDPSPGSCTIAELGNDLFRVIDELAPRGPLLLVGHSMGGMSILACARQHPTLFRERVIGLVLISTTAAGVAAVGLGSNLRNPALDGFRLAVRASPRLVQGGRVAIRTIIWPILHAASFRSDVGRTLAAFTYAMIDDTPVTTVVKFLEALELHDESAALPVLAGIPAAVVSGDGDVVIPFQGAAKLAAALPMCELVKVRHAGHMVHLEHPDVVNDAIDRVLERASAELAQAR